MGQLLLGTERRAGSSSGVQGGGQGRGSQAYSQGIGKPRGNFWKVLLESCGGIRGKKADWT